MQNEWQKVRLGDIAEIRNGSTPSTAEERYYNGNISWATPKDLSDRPEKYFYFGERNISIEGAKSIGGVPIPSGSLLLTSRAPIGMLAINKKETYTNQGFKNIIVDKNSIEVEYLYYFLKHNVRNLINLGAGTTFKEISKTVLEQLEFSMPPLPTQTKIAKILSTLDDKIALNKKVNNELEQMARELYDYWFLQFDFPNAEGKPYKSSGGAMTYSEELKREIPVGWEVKKLYDIADTGAGGTPLSSKKEYYENGVIPWINSTELNYGYIISSEKFITKSGLNNSSAKIFPKNSILLALYGATAGKVSLLSISASTNQAICAIMPKNRESLYFIKFILESLYSYFISRSTGSARDNLSQEMVRNIELCVPNAELLQKFDTQVNPIFQKIQQNNQQSRKLAKLRDELLPMLMNGQIKINEVTD